MASITLNSLIHVSNGPFLLPPETFTWGAVNKGKVFFCGYPMSFRIIKNNSFVYLLQKNVWFLKFYNTMKLGHRTFFFLNPPDLKKNVAPRITTCNKTNQRRHDY